ncbi:hypothetical protein Poli38472_005140 [Pythium oligandrum]|uniref:Uncharacterized protein n=1 Tax=Pythium oligandrum TaxID=41045 RepID=A0A8K1FK72_PYTOL|nr:hypothetical protein Poli38472_005140 [Pythium oligandrum]|eukprot:TMW62522.1 hypothetical protein Poli38472_005140 [Pythium oligandrum]
MWRNRDVVVTLVGAAVAAGVALQLTKLVGSPGLTQLLWALQSKQHAKRRASLAEFRQEVKSAWVALCGTVFDVSGDPFFDARSGLYGPWVGHDATAVLVHGGVVGSKYSEQSVDVLLESSVELADVVSDGEEEKNAELAERRRQILQEWLVRFHSRYAVIGQLTDRYAGDDWDELRQELVPSLGGSARSRGQGKCPLGFGASRVVHENVVEDDEDNTERAEIRFQGQRYDVSGSALFQQPEGPFAHFVGHDVTYALAIQSNRVEDLDVVPTREYSYEEQVRLERYRVVFAKELRLIASSGQSSDGTNQSSQGVDLHAMIEQDVGITDLQQVLVEQIDVNVVCLRTTMTPLHKAVERNRLDLVQLLVSAGADVHASAALYDDETALQMAQRFGYVDIVDYLQAQL